MPDGYVVGVDAGATRTRCAVVAPDGTVLGRGTGGGANPNSGTGDPAAPLIEALRDALRDARHVHGLAPGEARGGMFGMAGAGSAGRERAIEAATRAWRICGLSGVPEVTDDLVVAFASGSSARKGALLLSGTGAGACAVRDGSVVRRADAAGWLVGDDGSAVWLAREGTRAALAALEGRGPRTTLATAVPRALGVPEDADQVQGVIAAVYAEPPARLGRIAPVVTTAATPRPPLDGGRPPDDGVDPAAAGDPVAVAICAEAARLLLASLDAVLEVAGDGPVVLAGGVLTTESPVTDAVRTGVKGRGRAHVRAGDGALGAAALARKALAQYERPWPNG
ncbi:MAG: N-acetylglucosamine kinase [Streptosporangiales bacterium]|nr:N-acetylglucosamine kinase [Streptosporangiales bacterium]